jgi:hypothetical protein
MQMSSDSKKKKSDGINRIGLWIDGMRGCFCMRNWGFPEISDRDLATKKAVEHRRAELYRIVPYRAIYPRFCDFSHKKKVAFPNSLKLYCFSLQKHPRLFSA